jgi:hypothetical protein
MTSRQTTSREEENYREAVESIRLGYAHFKKGRAKPAEQVYEALSQKHGFPR